MPSNNQSPTPPVTRRDFIKKGAAGAAAVGAASAVFGTPAAARAQGANQRLRVAFIGTGGRCQAHLNVVLQLQQEGQNIEAVAVCDVFNRYRERAAAKILRVAENEPYKTGDYREILDDQEIDVVLIATPDHWHARMTIDALKAGKSVFCEKPMTHTIAEAQEVVSVWKSTGGVMQVGVQGTSDQRYKAANEFIRAGGIGKVVQAQTEYYRNSGMGQWRYYNLTRDMTPANIDWKMFLGTEFGLAPDLPFDRALFGQWRCYWPFGSGLYTDLFVHRLTAMSTALGVRYPRRVVGGGGIFLEYDGREVPDTATIIADYEEGLQILVTAAMCCDHKIEQCIRGHHGTIVFSSGRDKDDKPRTGFDFIPQRPQVTRLREVEPEHVPAYQPEDPTKAHWENFLEAIEQKNPGHCNNPPDLGAAAIVTISMGAESYRRGKVLEWDASAGKVVESSDAYALMWEGMSKKHSEPRHVAGWNPESKDPMFSRQIPPDYQDLAGPWKDDRTDPAA